MTELFKKPTTFTRIEFWAITTIFAFGILFFTVNIFEWDDNAFADAPYRRSFDEVNMRYSFYGNFFFPQLINYVFQFFFVLYMNFVLIPKFITKKALLRNIFLFFLLFVLAAILFGITGTYLKGYLYAGNKDRDAIDQTIFSDGIEKAWIMIWLLIIYTAIKYAGIYLLGMSEKIQAKYKFIRKEAIVAAIIWMVGLLFLRIVRADILLGWALVIPSAIALYLYSFYKLIPRSLAHPNYQFFLYVVKCAIILFFSFFAIYFLSLFITGDDDAGAGYSAFNSFFQLFITVPITWVLYKRYLKGNEEINVLQNELGKSNANLDFLRSQINPHFLFNALNTIYGTAIQEKAERTSEGIEKLGDMMRFMLQENMQEKISLAREVEYLNNYISLQKLRTDPNPNIKIDTNIEEQVHTIQIAPMLLIPFVENAFKHGISFREQSYIKISLEFVHNTLYLDVANSKHIKPENDPEKGKSGIGLNNVKQRLQLLYKGKHELLIRETAKDFFVHLTLQLA
jgi:hypothetical protein